MSVEITTAFVQQYRGNVIHLCQQKGSRLQGAVRVESGLVGKAAYVDRIGAVTAQKKTSRHSDTPQFNTPHSRRRLTMFDYQWADLIDQEDKIRILINPDSEYVIAGVNSMGRAKDDELFAAFTGPAWGGEDGSTQVDLPAGQKVAQGSASLTLAKLMAAKEIFGLNDLDPDEALFIAVTPKMLTAMLNTTEVKSADYNTVKALVKGDIDSFMGFKFITSNRNLKDITSSTYRCAVAWAQSGVVLGIGADIKTRVTERPDKSYAVQPYIAMTIGATRVEDEKVVEIPCLATD